LSFLNDFLDDSCMIWCGGPWPSLLGFHHFILRYIV
jgi:hypothetical protein